MQNISNDISLRNMLCQNLINSGSKSRSTNREIFLFNSCVQKEKLISLRFCITMLSILSTPSVYKTLVRGGVLLCKSQQLMLILDTDPKASTKYRTFHPFKPIQICVRWDLSYSIKAISDQIEATVGKSIPYPLKEIICHVQLRYMLI